MTLDGQNKNLLPYITLPIFRKHEDFVSRQFKKVFEKLDQHSEILNQHSRILDQHSKILEIVLKEMQEHSKEAREHRIMINELNRASLY